MGWVLLLLAGVLGLVVFVRLAPVVPGRWHDGALPVAAPGAGAHVDVFDVAGDGQAALERLHDVARGTPRTRVIAGGPETGRVTYETRSRVVGFPDYTTVALEPAGDGAGAAIRMHARLRFGKADFGVNAARVRDWARRAALGGGA